MQKTLDYYRDGIAGFDLGNIDGMQYAVSVVTVDGAPMLADIFRRAAYQVGTYGGWRWESSSKHPFNYRSAPVWGELAARIEALAAIHR